MHVIVKGHVMELIVKKVYYHEGVIIVNALAKGAWEYSIYHWMIPWLARCFQKNTLEEK
jgi:hypothetical protein